MCALGTTLTLHDKKWQMQCPAPELAGKMRAQLKLATLLLIVWRQRADVDWPTCFPAHTS